jgi:hypothetical protein
MLHQIRHTCHSPANRQVERLVNTYASILNLTIKDLHRHATRPNQYVAYFTRGRGFDKKFFYANAPILARLFNGNGSAPYLAILKCLAFKQCANCGLTGTGSHGLQHHHFQQQMVEVNQRGKWKYSAITIDREALSSCQFIARQLKREAEKKEAWVAKKESRPTTVTMEEWERKKKLLAITMKVQERKLESSD